jgi:hypothetical protein
VRPIAAVSLVAVVGLCLARASLCCGAGWGRGMSPQACFAARLAHPAAAALLEARRAWQQALLDIKPNMEVLAAAAPDAIDTQGRWRQRLMARDRNGYLWQAGAAAASAVAQARSADETYEALLWLALIECGHGRHREELRVARRLVVLRPQDAAALASLRRAAQCNALKRLG